MVRDTLFMVKLPQNIGLALLLGIKLKMGGRASTRSAQITGSLGLSFPLQVSAGVFAR